MKTLLLFLIMLCSIGLYGQSIPLPESPYVHPWENQWGFDGVHQTDWQVNERDCTYYEYIIDTLTARQDSASGRWIMKRWLRSKYRSAPPLIPAPTYLHAYLYSFPYDTLTFEDRLGVITDDWSDSDTIFIRDRNIRALAIPGTVNNDVFDWQDVKESLPLIEIQASKPVVIERCVFVNAGDMIHVRSQGSRVMIRENIFIGLEPTIDDFPRGRAVSIKHGTEAIIRNNYAESCRGYYIEDSEYDNVTISFNKHKNVDGRYRNYSKNRESQSPAAFAKVRNCRIKYISITANEILNYPNESAMHAAIMFSRVSVEQDPEATEHMTIHDNFIYGTWSFPDAENNKKFDGAAIAFGGSDRMRHGDVRYNWIVAGRGIFFDNTENSMVTNNRILFSGLHPNERKYRPEQRTFSITDSYQSGTIVVNGFQDNRVQFNSKILVHDAEMENEWFDQPINTTPSYINNIEKVGATLRDEQADFIAWRFMATIDRGYTIGPHKEWRER